MARSGRKRNLKAKRNQTTLEGRGQGKDYGTVELQLKRAEAIGAPIRAITEEGQSGRVFASGDMTLSRSQLGRLRAKGELGQEQFEAAEKYQAMCWSVWGKPFARAFDISELLGEYDGDRDRIRHDLVRIDKRIANISRHTLDDIKNLCQYDRRPAFLRSRNDIRRGKGRKRLLAGIDELTFVFGYARKAA